MDEALGSDVHDWDFDCSLGSDFDGLDSAHIVCSDIDFLEESADFGVKIEPVIGVLASDLANLHLPD